MLNRVQLFVTPWTAARQASLSYTVSQSLLKFMSIELVMLPNHLILCRPLLLLLSFLLLLSHQGLFQWVTSSHQVAKVLEFQLQHRSFQWAPRTDHLYDWLVGSPCSLAKTPSYSFLYPPEHWANICCLVTKYVQLFCDPMTSQAPLSMGFPRQEYWSGLPFHSPEESSWPKNWTCISCTGRQIFAAEPPGKPTEQREEAQKMILNESVSKKR